MPAGAHAAYMGIHGGTVPVSLWATKDSTYMVALAGRTGNDFLRALQASFDDAETTLEQADTETSETSGVQTTTPASFPSSSRFTANATVLMAGTAAGKMPGSAEFARTIQGR